LIQKQFDIVLSDREQYELQGFLDGNESAARFVENLVKVIEECSQMPIHEELLHRDPAQLFELIVARISRGDSPTWFAAIVNLIRTRKPRIDVRDQTDLERLRAKNKATTEQNQSHPQLAKAHDPGSSLQAYRERIHSKGAAQQLNPESEAVSLAVAIKQRVARNNVQEQLAGFAANGSISMMPPEASQALADSMDAIFKTSSNPIYVAEQMNQVDEEIKLISQSRELSQPLPQSQASQSADWEAPPRDDQWQTLPNGSDQWQTVHTTHDWDEQSMVAAQVGLGTRIETETETITTQAIASAEEVMPPVTPQQELKQDCQQDAQDEWQTINYEPPPQAKEIKPSTCIPVDDIIAYMNSVFMERQEATPQQAQLPISAMAPAPMPAAPPQPLEISAAPDERLAKTMSLSGNCIPVDDIIAHVSNLFMEHEPKNRSIPRQISPNVAQNQEQTPDQFASGNWPQMNCVTLDKSRLARLGTTIDARTSDDTASASGGQITSFGQFILDKNRQKAIGAIANAIVNLPTAKVLSENESVALRECLRPIEEQEGVAGCLIIGYDGMIITTTLPQSADGDAFSAWALLTYMTSQEVLKQLGHVAMKQLVSRTESGYLLLADFGQGLLLAVSENASTEAMLPLMRSVRRVTAA